MRFPHIIIAAIFLVNPAMAGESTMFKTDVQPPFCPDVQILQAKIAELVNVNKQLGMRAKVMTDLAAGLQAKHSEPPRAMKTVRRGWHHCKSGRTRRNGVCGRWTN